MARKIIQIALTEGRDEEDGHFLALCDDGTVWSRVEKARPEKARLANLSDVVVTPSYYWRQIPGIPQDEAASITKMDG